MQIKTVSDFKKDFKKHGSKLALSDAWIEVMYLLLRNLPLPEKYKDHPLKGNWYGYRDCHIKPDLVLIYKIENDVLFLARLGSHSELF